MFTAMVYVLIAAMIGSFVMDIIGGVMKIAQAHELRKEWKEFEENMISLMESSDEAVNQWSLQLGSEIDQWVGAANKQSDTWRINLFKLMRNLEKEQVEGLQAASHEINLIKEKLGMNDTTSVSDEDFKKIKENILNIEKQFTPARYIVAKQLPFIPVGGELTYNVKDRKYHYGYFSIHESIIGQSDFFEKVYNKSEEAAK